MVMEYKGTRAAENFLVKRATSMSASAEMLCGHAEGTEGVGNLGGKKHRIWGTHSTARKVSLDPYRSDVVLPKQLKIDAYTPVPGNSGR